MPAVTTEQAYDTLIRGMENVWKAISRSASLWAKNPGMNASTAMSSVGPQLNAVIRDLKDTFIPTALPTTRASLMTIKKMLEDYRASIQAASGVPLLKNASEAVTEWQHIVQETRKQILSDKATTGKITAELSRLAA